MPPVPPDVFGPAWADDRMLLGDRVRWQQVEVAVADEERSLLVAVVRDDRVTLLGRGDPAGAVELVAERVASRREAGLLTAVGWMSLPRGAQVDGDLLGALGLDRYSSWDWLVTDREPPTTSAEDRVERLDPAVDAGAITRCLADANPGTTADPTGPWEAAWLGVREPGGELLGVFGASRRGGRGDGAFSWHLHGLGVRPRARAQGLGAALAASLTRLGLAEGAQWVSLGMFADNATARRLYERLGFAPAAEFASFGPPGSRRPPT